MEKSTWNFRLYIVSFSRSRLKSFEIHPPCISGVKTIPNDMQWLLLSDRSSRSRCDFTFSSNFQQAIVELFCLKITCNKANVTSLKMFLQYQWNDTLFSHDFRPISCHRVLCYIFMSHVSPFDNPHKTKLKHTFGMSHVNFLFVNGDELYQLETLTEYWPVSLIIDTCFSIWNSYCHRLASTV